MEPFRTLCTHLIAVMPEISLSIATTIADRKQDLLRPCAQWTITFLPSFKTPTTNLAIFNTLSRSSRVKSPSRIRQQAQFTSRAIFFVGGVFMATIKSIFSLLTSESGLLKRRREPQVYKPGIISHSNASSSGVSIGPETHNGSSCLFIFLWWFLLKIEN